MYNVFTVKSHRREANTVFLGKFKAASQQLEAPFTNKYNINKQNNGLHVPSTLTGGFTGNQQDRLELHETSEAAPPRGGQQVARRRHLSTHGRVIAVIGND